MLVKGHGDRGGAKPVGLPQFGCTLLHQLDAWAALLCRNLLQVENIPDGGVVRLHLVVGNFGWPACLKNGFGWNGGYIRVNQRTAANTSAGDDSHSFKGSEIGPPVIFLRRGVAPNPFVLYVSRVGVFGPLFPAFEDQNLLIFFGLADSR